MSTQDKHSEKTLLAILICLVVGFAVYHKKSQAPVDQATTLSSTLSPQDASDPYADINRHMQDADVIAEVRRTHLEADNKRSLYIDPSDVGYLQNSKDSKYSKHLEVHQPNHAAEVMGDLHESQRDYGWSNSPEATIERELAEKKWIDQYDLEMRRQYIRQFVENAREDGFEILLDENLEVVEIKQIPQRARRHR